ncbi:hypothetical protein [Aeromicrobium sp.]|uniref:hypothetical protein n=1 Tax=Aeromicrobium sp. TaxID=1871063 RepID=UPI0019B780DF|nr:hypothetical protein [Aeromicrobium sp.]MBC7631580.1 hypothetical protein [Aeromicrobium sp.]
MADDIEEARMPVGQVLNGLTIHPLADGDRALSAFVMVKVADPDGDTGWAFRTTEPPNLEELLGALMIQVELVKKSILEEWDGE